MSWLGAAYCCLLFAGAVALGEGLPIAENPAASAPDTAALISQLDSAEFSERQAATERLREAGLPVLRELEQVALAGSREASARAFEIFRDHLAQGDRELQASVSAALDRLAASGSATTAQRARNILSPPKPATIMMPGAAPQFPAPPGRANFGFVPPGFAPPNGIRRISMTEINGKRSVEIDERERRVTLVSEPTGAIQAEVSEVQNGRNVTRTVIANSLDELKRKDAELGRLYEQYNRPGPGPVGGIGPAAPFGFVPARPPGLTPADLARRQLEAINNVIEQHKRQLPADPSLQHRIDALERSKQQFRNLLPAEAPRLAR